MKIFKLLKDIPIRFKLIIGFILIISINSISGVMSINIMKQLGELVNLTYDKALMSGTFAQASKFDFSEYDSEIENALLSIDSEELKKHKLKSTRIYNTLVEDLNVVEERALSSKSAALVKDIITNLNLLEIKKNELINEKEKQLSKNIAVSPLVILDKWEQDKLKSLLYKRLTALYDDAADVGYHFRMSSEETNKRNLSRTVWILVFCTIIGLTLSFLISYLVINPLFKLKKICNEFSEGNYSARSDIKTKDEFGTLAKSFNFMLQTIEEKDENISSLLSSLPFGLFYFNEKGIISKERSLSTDLIFPEFAQYSTLTDFYNAHNCSNRKIQNIIDVTFKGVIPFDSAVFLFPDIIETNLKEDKRIIQLGFRPKYNSKGKLEKVILIAEDITEKNKALAESSRLTERVQRVSKISYDIPGFKEFLPGVRQLFDSNIKILTEKNTNNESDFIRNLHSTKGLLGVFSFNTCATLVHEIEELCKDEFVSRLPMLLEKLEDTKRIFEEQVNDIIQLLALSTESGFKYYNKNKISIIKDLVIKSQNVELLDKISDIDKFPIHQVLAKYINHAKDTTEKFEDKKIQILFEDSDEISFEEVHVVDSALMHLINNSIDHGIETQQVRLEKNKNEIGEIRISFKRGMDQSLEFKIKDDGQGINGDYLLEKAVNLGLVSSSIGESISLEDKNNLIFISGLSSKEEASETSGRGVGMDAVKTYVESLGGSISLATSLGLGTTFTLKVPAFKNT